MVCKIRKTIPHHLTKHHTVVCVLAENTPPQDMMSSEKTSSSRWLWWQMSTPQLSPLSPPDFCLMLQLMEAPRKTLNNWLWPHICFYHWRKTRRGRRLESSPRLSLQEWDRGMRRNREKSEGNEAMEGDPSHFGLFSVNQLHLISPYPPLYPEAQLSKPLTSPLLQWMCARQSIPPQYLLCSIKNAFWAFPPCLSKMLFYRCLHHVKLRLIVEVEISQIILKSSFVLRSQNLNINRKFLIIYILL